MTVHRLAWAGLFGLSCTGLCAPAYAQTTDTGTPASEAPEQATDTADPAAQALTRVPMKSGRDMSPSALLGDTQSSPPPGLIGDWQRIRTKLGERGIGVSARYASETAYNVTGGTRQLVTETGQFDADMLLDLDKIVGLKGGAFQATITWRRGRNLTTEAGINALQQVQEVFGRGQTVRLTQLWYEQKIGDSVEVKLGRTDPGEDFAAFSCHFENLSFCGAQPGNLVGDYWFNWPISQWGARIRVDLRDNFYVQTAAYEINPRNLDNDFFIGHFRGATGVLLPVEAGWMRGGDGGHVGSYKVGGWLATSKGNDVFLDINRQPIVLTGQPPLQHSGRYGVYLSMQQQLTGTSKNGKSVTGLSFFANITQADRKTSVTDNQVAIGLFYKGLMPSVPGDVLGIGLARTNVNGRAAEGDRLIPGTPVRHAEYAAEIYYSLHPLDWLELRPNVQWIHNPGGIRSADDATVLGMKAAITL